MSFRGEEDLIWKANFTSVECTEGTTGEALAAKVIEAFAENDIPLNHWVSDMSDGCTAMQGKMNGCHIKLKQYQPHLPDIGGCFAHDGCNIIKGGVKVFNPRLTTVYSSIHANLEKHSMKKNRKFKEISEDAGVDFHHTGRYMILKYVNI